MTRSCGDGLAFASAERSAELRRENRAPQWQNLSRPHFPYSCLSAADPNTDWLDGCLDTDRNGFVLSGAGVRPHETSQRGVFAIGVVRAGSTKRVAAAVGEGAAVGAQIHDDGRTFGPGKRMTSCNHSSTISEVTPSALGCEDCLQTGSRWVHLRLCRTCGHVGCCDQSPNRHATAHYHATRHPIIEGYDPPEGWGWCYVDEMEIDLPDTTPQRGPIPRY